MNIKKPKFWDYKKPNYLAYLFFPISYILQLLIFLKIKITPIKKHSKIKTICVGNIYLGGTGKTSLSLKINKIFDEKKIKSCFIKKDYLSQLDEQKILEKNGKLFKANYRTDAITQAEKNDYEVAILDDGLQDPSLNCNLNIVCFNDLNWVGNGLTIPSGPLRENLKNIKKYAHVFLNGNMENLNDIKNTIFEIDPNIKIYVGKYVPLNLNEFNKNNNYLAFSGIGNHKTFISMLKKNNFKVIKDIEFPDHYEYSKSDIDQIISVSKDIDCKIITTEKDFYRLDKFNLDQIKVLKSELEIINEKEFLETLDMIYE